MASKLELRFTGPGTSGQSINFVPGTAYLFRANRLGSRQVKVGNSAFDTARNFYDAFQADDNYLNIFNTTYQATNIAPDGSQMPDGVTHGLVTIEHPDNNYFDNVSNNTDFITDSSETTQVEEEPEINISLAQASDNPCGKYKLVITTAETEGTISVETPLGSGNSQIIDIDGSATYELDIVRPTAAGQTGVVKLRNSLGVTIASVIFAPPKVLAIQSVSVSGTPFGAVATINATTGLNRQYSLDNTNFQGSQEYSGLLAGEYTAYVKDDLGCEKSKTFTITQEQASGLTAEEFIEMPIHNSIRFAKRTGNTFLNFLSTETPGYIEMHHYEQPWKIGDIVRQQFRSAYNNHKLIMMDCQGNETEIPVVKKSNNINRINIFEGNYTEKEGRVAVYFTYGNIYNPDGSLQEEGHILEGRLPIWYEEGMYIDIEGIGVTQVERIFIDPDGVRYAITQKSAAGTETGKKITSIHSEHPYEIYEFEVNYLVEGSFQLRLEYWNNEKEFYLSEIQEVYNDLPETFLKTEWWSEDNNSVFYGTGIRHFRWIEWEKYFTLIPKGEKETFDTDTTVKNINSKTFAVYELILRKMPMEVARGLQTGFDHADYIVINGAVFLCEELVELQKEGEWYYPVARLTLTDQTIVGQQQITGGIEGRFLAVTKDANGVTFLRL
ncbi:hypothetical protein [Salinimicrobium sp. GXAS 041]|uniref:hypothetical protein n=1 Tax=Salinimicrobium sp. GXAS 041 TaxID=3400806 RepID=UPI003C7932FB